MKPLTLAKTGDLIKIKKIVGRGELKKHLESLGLTAGEDVSVVSRLAGSFIINVRGSRIGLDNALASCVLI